MKKLLFVRYGGLSSVPQRGYDKDMPGFYSPPARRGIYAMPADAIATLLFVESSVPNAKTGFDSRRMEWVRDSEGNPVQAESDDGKRLQRISAEYPFGPFGGKPKYMRCQRTTDGPWLIVRFKKPRTFRYDGELWHHLPLPRNEILIERGEWVLSTSQAHHQAFKTEFNKIVHNHQGKINRGNFDDDRFARFEVFIEKV